MLDEKNASAAVDIYDSNSGLRLSLSKGEIVRQTCEAILAAEEFEENSSVVFEPRFLIYPAACISAVWLNSKSKQYFVTLGKGSDKPNFVSLAEFVAIFPDLIRANVCYSFDVRNKLDTLGVSFVGGPVLLPQNILVAKSHNDFIYDLTVATIRKLWRAKQIDEGRIEPVNMLPQQFAQHYSALVVLPAIFFPYEELRSRLSSCSRSLKIIIEYLEQVYADQECLVRATVVVSINLTLPR